MSSHDNKYQEKSKNKEPGELAKKLLHYIPQDSTILDLGAGAGVDSRYFADNGHFVTAIDRETTVIQDDWKNYTEKFTFHSSENVLNLLENYEIIHLENKEYDGQSMRPSGEIIDKHWNVIEVIAKKMK